MSFASIWGITSKMALVIIKKKNRISRPADNFQVKKGCIREACVLIPSVPEFCHTFFQHLLQLQLICQDHFLNLIQKSQYFSFNFIAMRFINKNKEPLKICLPPNLWLVQWRYKFESHQSINLFRFHFCNFLHSLSPKKILFFFFLLKDGSLCVMSKNFITTDDCQYYTKHATSFLVSDRTLRG